MLGGFRDGNLQDLLHGRLIRHPHATTRSLQVHSSLIQRLCLEKELEGHRGCVNTISWNSKGSLLISGSDDYRINVWSYTDQKLLHSIETGHSANIFCTKFIPETSDELIASGAGDAEVRLFNLSHLSGGLADENTITPSALYLCHTRRVKKLAVEVGNPNVVWSASSSVNMISGKVILALWQDPLDRNVEMFWVWTSCGSVQMGCVRSAAHFILLSIKWSFSAHLDLRSGSKRSLNDPPKGALVLKSCDISSTRPHLIIVGGSDAFARLYDRRMLPPLTSCGMRMAPPPCVNYFCPMHLSYNGRSSLHLTHVTFSPNGEEVLLSYSGEHVYLFNVDSVKGSEIKYGPGDASKLMKFTSAPNGVDLQTGHKKRPCITPDTLIEKRNKLLEYAETSSREGLIANYCHAIEACNEILFGNDHEIDPSVRHECLCLRASLFLKRKWKNDAHMAVRDCQNARKICSSSVTPLVLISEALSQLEKLKEALEFALAAHCLAPSDSNIEKWLQKLRKDVAAAESEKNSKFSNGSPHFDTRGARVLSLGDILCRTYRDILHDPQRSERGDSDYYEEMEVALEASTSGDGWHDAESDILAERISLVIQQRDDSGKEPYRTNGYNGSTQSSLAETMFYTPEAAVDMKRRYVGHCNVGTDIKQANFLGQRGEYVASGSDDGRWFIWEKRTGRLVKMLLGDEAVVNCVQCHPFDCVVATSGIDNTIKLWSPTAPAPSIVAGGPAGPEAVNIYDAIDNNQRRLISDQEIILPFEILQRFQMHGLAEGSLDPFECTQS
ncbi:hypothetical protein MLD38_022412 [Melastoma candidum]|uniref:Uncharacterized protein n=1 Tax=Melastoma candidum TaxID=119954 RepID=A0ACB9QKD3_9MYRT|nr:hypothetical protein MLD38_022412 [Melastoma candidum]